MYALVSFAIVAMLAPAAPVSDVSPELRETLVTARNQSIRGDFAGARAILEAALAASPDSPDLIDALGALEQDMGDYLAAERSYRKALSLLPPGEELRRARILNNVATLYIETDRPSDAFDAASELQAVPFAEIEDSPPDAATILSTMAAIRRLRGDDESAERLYERSIGYWNRAPGGEPMVGHVTTSLGNMHIQQGKYDEAAMYFRQAIGLMETSVGPDHAMLIRPLYGLAACMCLTGETAGAETVAHRAADLSRQRMGSRHPFTARVLQLQGQVLRKLGRKREARPLEKEAGNILRNVAERNLSGFTIDVRELSRKKPRG